MKITVLCVVGLLAVVTATVADVAVTKYNTSVLNHLNE
jgi:hypothetical protein